MKKRANNNFQRSKNKKIEKDNTAVLSKCHSANMRESVVDFTPILSCIQCQCFVKGVPFKPRPDFTELELS